MKKIHNSNHTWDSIDDNSVLPEEVSHRIWNGVDQKYRKYRRRRKLKLLSLLIPLFVLFLFLNYNKEYISNPSELVYETTVNRDTVLLPDGSSVQLEPYTKMVVAAHFGHDQRHVTFDGRGYFDIAKDKNKPFIVDGAGFSVEVLGTKFHLLDHGKEQKVVLLEGKVKVTKGKQPVYLSTNEVWKYVEGIGEQNYMLAVAKQSFSFQKEKLSVVLGLLERRYGVTIEYPEELKDRKVSGEFNGNLQQILKIVCFPFDLQVQQLNENKISLK